MTTRSLAFLFLIALLGHIPARAVDAKIKQPNGRPTYALEPIVLDGAESSQGSDVTYEWKVQYNPPYTGAPAVPDIENADKAMAKFTPTAWGAYAFTLMVSQGTDQKVAHFTAHVLNNPAVDTSPTFPGAKKVLYKQAPDALGGTANLYLHVFNPPDWQATDKRGVVILFHGGAWVSGSPDRYVPEAQYFASRGLVGIAPQYRLGGREGVKPEDCVADAKSVVRYVRAHAAELGIDPNKVAVGGESAGAHIAACTGTIPGMDDPKDDLSVSCVPNALLLYFPFQMICTSGKHAAEISPLKFVTPKTPPTLFVAGEMDGIAPAERGIDWGNQMAGGNPYRFFIYKRAHHPSGHHDMTKPGDDNDMVRQTDLFLVSLGFMTGAPTVPPMDDAAIAALHVDPKDFKPLPPPPAPPKKS
jgi:acetyl esterase/lipase